MIIVVLLTIRFNENLWSKNDVTSFVRVNLEYSIATNWFVAILLQL